MAGLFSPSNTDAQDDAVAVAVAGSIRLTLERLTPGQVKVVLSRIGYCTNCGTDIKDSHNGKIIVPCYRCGEGCPVFI